jgi:hypothetical protein
MAQKTLYMETTQIEPDKSASEICSALVQAGARAVSLEYDGQRRICGLTWAMRIGTAECNFKLPARVEPVFALLKAKRAGGKDQLYAQARRVAWRQLHRWILAQLAMIETGMVSGGEVFLPYVVNESGQCF